MKNKTVLGIDIGTTAIKMVLLSIIDSTHTMIEREISMPPDLISLFPGWAEEDPFVWKSHMLKMLSTLSKEEDLSSLEAIALTGMTPALIMLDEDGNPLRNTILQNDMRTGQEIEYLKAQLEKDSSYFKKTGCHVNSQNIAPRMLYLYEHERDVFDKTRFICGSYDYGAFILTGKLYIERNWALESGLFTLENELIDDVLHLSHIEKSWIPEVAPFRTLIGCVSKEISLATGLKVYDPFITKDVVDNQYHNLNEFLSDIDMVVIMVKHNEIKDNVEKLKDKVILDCHNIIKLPGVYHI